MSRMLVLLLVGSFLLAVATAGSESAWHIDGTPDKPPFTLTLPKSQQPFYIFDCSTGENVKVTQIGVTQLLDIKTNQKIGDGPDAVLTPGAALMALHVNDVEPRLIPAKGVHNPSRGWDLTIEIPKSAPAFVALPKATLMTLFTTGYTTAVVLDDADRKVIRDFVARCVAM